MSAHRFLGAALALGLTWGTPGAWAQGNAWRVKEVFDAGPSVYVRALTVEPSRGALWVGTSAGVHEVDLASGKLRNTFTRKEGLANEYVFAIGIDRKGQKWFGTNAGGVSRYKDGQWKTFFPMHGLADYWIYSFAEQRGGDFWIGTWAGVNKVDAKTGKFTTYVKELVNEWVYGITVDAQDRVWFGTEGGVSMYDGKVWKSWTHKDGLGAPNSENLPFSANTGLGTRSRHDLSVSAEGPATYNPNYTFSDAQREGRQHLGRHLGRRRGALGRQGLDQPHDQGRPGRQHRLQRGAGPRRRSLVRDQQRRFALRRQDLEELRHEGGPAGTQRVCDRGRPRWRRLGRHPQGRGTPDPLTAAP